MRNSTLIRPRPDARYHGLDAGNIGPLEIAIVLIIALIVFGPKRLPELGSSLGRGIREFEGSVSGEKHDDDDEPEVKAIRRRRRRPTARRRAAGRARGRSRQTQLRRAGMARRVKAVSHEDRLTLVEHLDELRIRHHRLHRRLRRRPGALLLAEPPAAGNRLRAAARATTRS